MNNILKVASAVALLVVANVATAEKTNPGCWIDQSTGYLCCNIPGGDPYCDPATGPDTE